jgi:hypothetical protein
VTEGYSLFFEAAEAAPMPTLNLTIDARSLTLKITKIIKLGTTDAGPVWAILVSQF